MKKVQEIATLEEVLTSHNKIPKLKEQVSELEACKKKECEVQSENVKWQMMKCDKEKESLET